MMIVILAIAIMVGGVFVLFILGGAAISLAVIGYLVGEQILFDRQRFQYAGILSALFVYFLLVVVKLQERRHGLPI